MEAKNSVQNLGLSEPVRDVVVLEVLVLLRAGRVRAGLVNRVTVVGGYLGHFPALGAGQAFEGLDVHGSGLGFGRPALVLSDGGMERDQLGLPRLMDAVEAELFHRGRAQVGRRRETARLASGEFGEVVPERFDVDLFIHWWIINPFMDTRQREFLSFYG